MLGMLETDAARPQSMEALLEGAMQAVTGDPAWLSYTDDRGGGDSTGKRCSRLMRTLESLHLTCSSDLDSSTARQAAVVRATVQVIKQLTENGGVVRKEVAEVVAAVANAMKSQDVYAAIKNLVTACARKCQLASSLKIITSLETRHAVNVALATAAFRNELLMIVCGSAIAHTQHITVNEYANFEICAFLAALHGGPEYLRVHVPPPRRQHRRVRHGDGEDSGAVRDEVRARRRAHLAGSTAAHPGARAIPPWPGPSGVRLFNNPPNQRNTSVLLKA